MKLFEPASRVRKEPGEPGEIEPNRQLQPGELSMSSYGNNFRNVRLILVREYLARVRRRIFVIATLVMVFLVIAATFLPTFIQLFGASSRNRIAVIENTGPVAGQDIVLYLNRFLNFSEEGGTPGQAGPSGGNSRGNYLVNKVTPSEETTYRQKVRDGKLDSLLVVSRDSGGELNFENYSRVNSEGTEYLRLRQGLATLAIYDRLSRSGLPGDQIQKIFGPPQLINSNQLQAGERLKETGSDADLLLNFILVILLFTTIYTYGVAVAQGAAEEKSNRVMEIMISAASPFQLMIGKILGIGLAGFTQVGLVALGGIAGFFIQFPLKDLLLGTGAANSGPLIPTGLSVGAFLFFLLFYVLGFMLWASLYAAVGSLVSRQEDVQSALTPLSLLSTTAYIAVSIGLQAIDAPWVTFLSYVPFFTPMLMFARLARGRASTWEGILAVIILVVSSLVLTWLCSRVYRAGVLLYGNKPTFRQVLKLMWSR